MAKKIHEQLKDCTTKEERISLKATGIKKALKLGKYKRYA